MARLLPKSPEVFTDLAAVSVAISASPVAYRAPANVMSGLFLKVTVLKAENPAKRGRPAAKSMSAIVTTAVLSDASASAGRHSPVAERHRGPARARVRDELKLAMRESALDVTVDRHCALMNQP